VDHDASTNSIDGHADEGEHDAAVQKVCNGYLGHGAGGRKSWDYCRGCHEKGTNGLGKPMFRFHSHARVPGVCLAPVGLTPLQYPAPVHAIDRLTPTFLFTEASRSILRDYIIPNLLVLQCHQVADSAVDLDGIT
jgi:hypothetical protein